MEKWTEFVKCSAPRGIAIDSKDRVWILANVNDSLVRYSPDKSAEVIIKGTPFEFPNQMVLDDEENAYVCDGYAKAFWQVKPGSQPEKLISGEPFKNPVGITRDGGKLIVADPHLRVCSQSMLRANLRQRFFPSLNRDPLLLKIAAHQHDYFSRQTHSCPKKRVYVPAIGPGLQTVALRLVRNPSPAGCEFLYLATITFSGVAAWRVVPKPVLHVHVSGACWFRINISGPFLVFGIVHLVTARKRKKQASHPGRLRSLRHKLSRFVFWLTSGSNRWRIRLETPGITVGRLLGARNKPISSSLALLAT